jgi:hypothetical protein
VFSKSEKKSGQCYDMIITIYSIKRKENFFSLFFFRVLKTALFSTRTKKQLKKVFSFIGHEVLFYETPFLHRATRNYVCWQSEEAAVVAGRVLNFGTKEGTTSFEPIERPITCVSALYDARQAS